MARDLKELFRVADEIAGRVAELNAGIVETIPWERVRNEMFGQRDED